MTTNSKPILFSGPMVRAIIDGLKTQTRRVVPGVDRYGLNSIKPCDGAPGTWGFHYRFIEFSKTKFSKCPYGSVGDELWVRECFRTTRAPYDRSGSLKERPEGFPTGTIRFRADVEDEVPIPYRPSIHMPRWASRITLKVTDIQVQELRRISDEDIVAEGLKRDPVNSLRNRWIRLWNEINAGRGYAWERNPLVWVVTFEVKEVRDASEI